MRLAPLLLLPLLAACNTTPTATTKTAAAPPVASPTAPAAGDLPPPDTARAKAVSALGDTLRVVRQRHNFSRSEGLADAFQLVFRGPSVLKGTAEFTITDPSGQVIFREMLTEPDLEAALVYEMKTPTAAPAAREAYVLRRIDQFFQPAQFQTPAIGPQATFPSTIKNLDQATWADLKRRPGTIGFNYLKGKENRQRLAWSPLKKQTIRVR